MSDNARPEVGSRWVAAGGTHPFTVLHAGETTAYVQYDDGGEGAVALIHFANGTFVPAPEPLPEPAAEAWFTIHRNGGRAGTYTTKDAATRAARSCRRPAIARYTLAEVIHVAGGA